MTSRSPVDNNTLRRESTKIHRLHRRIDATEGSTKTKATAMQMHQASWEQLQRSLKTGPKSQSNQQVSPQQDPPEYKTTHSYPSEKTRVTRTTDEPLRGTSNAEEVARSPSSITALSNTSRPHKCGRQLPESIGPREDTIESSNSKE
jgi:hypothetical protein